MIQQQSAPARRRRGPVPGGGRGRDALEPAGVDPRRAALPPARPWLAGEPDPDGAQHPRGAPVRRASLRDRLRGSLQTRVYMLLAVSVGDPGGAAGLGLRRPRVASRRSSWSRRGEWSARTVAGQVEEELNQGFEVLQRAATAVPREPGGPGPGAGAGGAPGPARAACTSPAGAFFLDATGQRGRRGARPRVPIHRAPRRTSPVVRTALETGRPAVTPFVAGVPGEHVYELVPVRDWEGRVTGLAGGDRGRRPAPPARHAPLPAPGRGGIGRDRRPRRADRWPPPSRGAPPPRRACSGVRGVIAAGQGDVPAAAATATPAGSQDARGRRW